VGYGCFMAFDMAKSKAVRAVQVFVGWGHHERTRAGLAGGCGGRVTWQLGATHLILRPCLVGSHFFHVRGSGPCAIWSHSWCPTVMGGHLHSRDCGGGPCVWSHSCWPSSSLRKRVARGGSLTWGLRWLVVGNGGTGAFTCHVVVNALLS